MNKLAFEQSVRNGIPLQEAAGFFHRIKKAGWADPPDDTGALEGMFTAPLEQVVLKLTEIAATKFKLMVAYHVYAESMRGVAQHGVAEVFHEHAEQERAAAEAYLKRAAALGSGPIHLPEIETPPASADPVGILQIMARAEQEGIAGQHELKVMVGEDNPLSFQIEQYMIEDQHHLDELWQMMPQGVGAAPVLGQPPAAAPAPEPSVEEAPPAEEKPAAKPEAKKEAADLVSLRKAVSSGGKKVVDDAAKSKAWSSFNNRGMSGLQLASLAGLGATAGAVSQSLLEAAHSPEMKQQQLEESGPIGRFMARHPASTGAVLGGLSGLNAGVGLDKALQGAPLRRILPHIVAMPAATTTLQAADQSMRRGELEELAKNASAAGDRLRAALRAARKAAPAAKKEAPAAAKAGKSLGEKLRQGASRYKDLLTGSKAKKYSERASGALHKAHVHARVAVNEARYGATAAEKSRLGQRAAKSLHRARRIGDVAKRENLKSRATQAATIAVPAAGALAVAHHKNKKDWEKVDKTNERLKKAFAIGLQKIGYQDPSQGQDPGAAPLPGDQPMTSPLPSMAQPGPQPMMAQPPGSQRLAPVNYLEAEETARRAQEANEANFYRSKAEEAGMATQDLQAQMQDMSAQMEQLQAQAAESQSQIMAANQEAVQANDSMLNQATLAARMRMGMQQLRAQMMEVASQDPEQLAAAAGGPTPMDVGQQAQAAAPGTAPAPTGLNGEAEVTGDAGAAPGADPGTPEASPSAGAAPGAIPGGQGSPSGGGGESAPEEPQKSESKDDEKKDSGQTTVSIKKGSIQEEVMGRLPYMAAGAGIGGLATGIMAARGKNIPTLRQKVDELKGQQDGGFGKSIELAKAQLALGEAEKAKAHPIQAGLKGGLTGAAIGGALGAAGPEIMSGGKDLMKNLQAVRQNL